MEHKADASAEAARAAVEGQAGPTTVRYRVRRKGMSEGYGLGRRDWAGLFEGARRAGQLGPDGRVDFVAFHRVMRVNAG